MMVSSHGAPKGGPTQCLLCGSHPSAIAIYVPIESVRRRLAGHPGAVIYALCDSCCGIEDRERVKCVERELFADLMLQ
jgi:hypothetical protein